jgi:hypothetical protein
MRGSHRVKSMSVPIGPFRADMGSRHIQWSEEVLSLHSTMFRTKQHTFQPKPITVEIIKTKGDFHVATFEVDLAEYISDKNHGSNSYDVNVTAKKCWGNATLLVGLHRTILISNINTCEVHNIHHRREQKCSYIHHVLSQ